MRACRCEDEQHSDANEFKKYAESEERRQRVLPFVVFGRTGFNFEVWTTTVIFAGMRKDFDVQAVAARPGIKRAEVRSRDVMALGFDAGAGNRNGLVSD